MTEPTLDELKKEYLSVMHAMQTGVAFTMEFNDSECTPKHFRVGINGTLCSISAITHILIEKGLFTEEEYFVKMIELLKKDVERYEKDLSAKSGTTINLK